MNILNEHKQKAQDLLNQGQNAVQGLQSKAQKQLEDVSLQLQMHKPDYAFYCFVNPVSGGNRAAQLLQLEAEKITFFLDKYGQPAQQQEHRKQFDGKTECELYFYNMQEKSSRERGAKNLKSDQQRGVTVRCMVGGGDGTVMWVVEEIQKAGVDMASCPIGIIPFGTGNDFSRVLGWGGDSPSDVCGKNLEVIKRSVKKWVNAVIEDFDIWDIKATTFDHGFFKVIKKTSEGFEKRVLKEKDPITQQETNMKIKRFKMCNYFSFGVDARIGFGFDKRRTTSACCNKCCYCWEGCKKLFLSTPPVINTLYSMEVVGDENSVLMENSGKQEINLDEKASTVEVLFTSPPSQPYQPVPGGPQKRFLKGSPVNLLCLNIPSYSGGASDIWTAARGSVSLVNPDNQKEKLQDQFKPQLFGDGVVEFVTFNTMLGLANERFINGQASRCAQGSGPFLFKFKQDDPKVAPVRQYLQVDGEYFCVFNPKFIKVRPCKTLPGGKIKVLVERSFRDKTNLKKASRP